MKNNNILILLLSTLGIGILCAIIASIAFTYYNGGFDKLAEESTDALQEAVIESQLSDLDAPTLIEEIQDSSNGSGINYLMLVPLMQKSQTCSSTLMLVETSMTIVQGNPSILDDEQNSTDIQAILEKAKTNCDGLGDDEIIAEYHPELIQKYAKAEKSIDKAIEYYEDYFTYKKSTYLVEGNNAYEEAFEDLGNAFEMLQELITSGTP